MPRRNARKSTERRQAPKGRTLGLVTDEGGRPVTDDGGRPIRKEAAGE